MRFLKVLGATAIIEGILLNTCPRNYILSWGDLTESDDFQELVKNLSMLSEKTLRISGMIEIALGFLLIGASRK